MRHFLNAFWVSGLALILTGCAFGVTNVKVDHSPLKPVEQRSGTVEIRPFTDVRKEDRQYIGTKRDGFGMPLGNIGIRNGQRVELLMTHFFEEALEQAGYTVKFRVNAERAQDDNAQIDAILEGEIEKFWMDLYMATWHDISIKVKLLSADGRKTLWERVISGGKANALWFGLPSEFAKVIQESLDVALNKAVQEFSSEEFYKAVNSGRSKTVPSPSGS